MKILLTDIETSPNTAYVWRIFKENVSLDQLIETSEVLCYSAKWYGEKGIIFDSIHQSRSKTMLNGIHSLLEQADIVVHFNGQNFDIPILQREFLIHGILPPAPFKQVDLYQVCKKQFKFVSNKLAHISKEIGIATKENKQDFTLWVRCMEGEESAWREMKAYNINDVVVLEQLYDKLLPWIKSHPNHGLYSGSSDMQCPNCGSTHLVRRGFAYTNALKYQRYNCSDCGNWIRSKKPVDVHLKAKVGNII